MSEFSYGRHNRKRSRILVRISAESNFDLFLLFGCKIHLWLIQNLISVHSSFDPNCSFDYLSLNPLTLQNNKNSQNLLVVYSSNLHYPMNNKRFRISLFVTQFYHGQSHLRSLSLFKLADLLFLMMATGGPFSITVKNDCFNIWTKIGE